MYAILYTAIRIISWLPLRVLYVLSDCLGFLAYYMVRYRRGVVRDNLTQSFPEKTPQEILRIEKAFYAFFADYIVETIKLCTISSREMARRMEFRGVEEMVRALKEENKLFAFIYLAHYGNWEWISSLGSRIREVDPEVDCGQIYHPLRNKAFDRLFLYMRGRFGGVGIPMKTTLRHVIRQRQAGKRTIIGFIADQGPKWSSIHHWTDFLHRRTAVLTGTEQMGKQVDALIYYAHIERPRRGYYRCTLSRMVDDVHAYPDYGVTDVYFRLLEQTIAARPELWLWTHKRWKRSYAEYQERQASAQTDKA